MEADTGAAEEPPSPQGSTPARPRSQLSPLARLYPDRLDKARHRSLQAPGLTPPLDLISDTAILSCCTSLSWQPGFQCTGQSVVIESLLRRTWRSIIDSCRLCSCGQPVAASTSSADKSASQQQASARPAGGSGARPAAPFVHP